MRLGRQRLELAAELDQEAIAFLPIVDELEAVEDFVDRHAAFPVPFLSGT